ncbi:MAG: hypothetical protein KIT84_08910 [Labilithrix sp.]|nr:hypothetical protein [Labilithrix sp.]MCW5811119.1 hypothetical protein [Labilithrix sp.]
MTAMTAHDERVRGALQRALATVPFYAKQSLAGLVTPDAPIDDVLARLPLLTRDRVRPTLPKQWFPEGRDAKAELAAGSVAVIEVGGAARVRALFDPKWWRKQELAALATNPHAKSVLDGEVGAFKDAVLWVPERGTGSCGAGDPGYDDRLEGTRLHLNSRQDPTFWTEPVMTRMLDELSLHETKALFADPFYLDVLARHAAILGRRLDVRGWISTMRARPTLAQRAALARVFQGTYIDVLGAREVGTLFVQQDDGNMHHAGISTHVELLRARVETPGAEDVALVVVTTLDREVQPLVRYVLGDLVQVAPNAPNAPNANGASIRTVEGTLDDALVRPDGALVTAGAIDRAIGDGPRGYQATQAAPGEVEIEVVGGSAAEVQERLAPLLAGMKVTARAATAIGVEPNGKYRTTRRTAPALAVEAVFETAGGDAAS